MLTNLIGHISKFYAAYFKKGSQDIFLEFTVNQPKLSMKLKTLFQGTIRNMQIVQSNSFDFNSVVRKWEPGPV
jgi:hypothetical protein